MVFGSSYINMLLIGTRTKLLTLGGMHFIVCLLTVLYFKAINLKMKVDNTPRERVCVCVGGGGGG